MCNVLIGERGAERCAERHALSYLNRLLELNIFVETEYWIQLFTHPVQRVQTLGLRKGHPETEHSIQTLASSTRASERIYRCQSVN